MKMWVKNFFEPYNLVDQEMYHMVVIPLQGMLLIWSSGELKEKRMKLRQGTSFNDIIMFKVFDLHV